MKKFAWIVALALLVVTGAAGLLEARNELGQGDSVLQQSVGFAVALYGVLGMIGAVGLWRRRRWSVTVCGVWGFSVIWAATIASFAFHDPTLSQQGTLIGVLSAFVACAALAVFVVWTAVRETRVPSIIPA